MSDRRESINELLKLHSEQLSMLNSQVIDLQREQLDHRKDTRILVDNQAQIKILLMESRDREGVRRYVKKLSGFIIGAAAISTAIYTVLSKIKFW